MFQDEKIVETKKCAISGEIFHITDKDLEFYDKVSPVFNGVKYPIPTPTLCPDCSAQQKFIRRNDKKFYKIKIGNKSCISMYNEDSPWNIIDSKDWWAQNYDIPQFDYNFGKNFFDQFGDLLKATPHPHIITMNSENSDYTNFNGFCKNSYLCAAGNYSEDIYYCYNAEKCLNCTDGLFIFDCENCSNAIHSSKCYNVHFSKHCEDCDNSWFLDECTGCSNCYCCSGLKNKSYNIFNIQYSKEEYENKLKEIKIAGYKGFIELMNKFYEFSKNIKKPLNYNFNSENAIGEYILNSKNCYNCYIMASDGSDCKNIINGFPGLRDSCNCCYCGEDSSLLYESMGSGASCYKNIFSTLVLNNSSNTIYCDYCITCKYCFGCSGLHNKQYCILNKQYTKEEYEALVPRIIEHMIKTGEWGEFFPTSMSPFGYNETMAQEYFPMTQEKAKQRGYKRQDKEYPINVPDGMATIKASDLPDNIKDVDDSILEKAILCEVTGKPFRIIKPELEFYRKHNLPIPRRHPDQRHLDRMALRNPRKLFDRVCDCPDCEDHHKEKGIFDPANFMMNNKTGKLGLKMKTTYSPDRPETVYCELCYNKTVY